MNELLLTANHVLKTPYLFSALGTVVATSLFLSPVFFNGDYKSASKTVAFIFGYIFFLALVFYSHYVDTNHMFMADISSASKLLAMYQSIIISSLIGFSYIIGLYLGVKIHRMVHKK